MDWVHSNFDNVPEILGWDNDSEITEELIDDIIGEFIGHDETGERYRTVDSCKVYFNPTEIVLEEIVI
jgi:hypothetical protein